MKAKIRIDGGIGQFAGAKTSREEAEQMQKEGQSQSLKFCRPERLGYAPARGALQSAGQTIRDRTPQSIVAVRNQNDDRSDFYFRFGEPQSQATAGIVDDEMPTTVITLIGEDQAQSFWFEPSPDLQAARRRRQGNGPGGDLRSPERRRNSGGNIGIDRKTPTPSAGQSPC